jgi:glioma pathogenesis-related protein 2
MLNATATVPAACLSAYLAAALNQTNFYRARHGSPPLTEDATIRKTSQKWANYLSDYDLFDHNDESSKLGYGENLAGNYATGSASTLTAAACAGKIKSKTSSRRVF